MYEHEEELTEEENEKRTNWHRLSGLIVGALFETLGYKTITEYDVAKKAQLLDIVVVRKDMPQTGQLLDSSYYQGFENLNEHNLISFKSFNEVFNKKSLEEFYGHYKKNKKESGAKEKQINLYALIYHYPRDLFKRFNYPELLHTIVKNRIYDLKLLTKVRFIITKETDHPVFGLLSNNVQQIESSINRLQKDSRLISQISSYLEKLFKHYAMEGIKMPYTKETFLKENYPDWYQKITYAEQKGMQEGMQEGMQKGMQKGEINMLETLYNQGVLSKEHYQERITPLMQKQASFQSSRI